MQLRGSKKRARRTPADDLIERFSKLDKLDDDRRELLWQTLIEFKTDIDGLNERLDALERKGEKR